MERRTGNSSCVWEAVCTFRFMQTAPAHSQACTSACGRESRDSGRRHLSKWGSAEAVMQKAGQRTGWRERITCISQPVDTKTISRGTYSPAASVGEPYFGKGRNCREESLYLPIRQGEGETGISPWPSTDSLWGWNLKGRLYPHTRRK